MSSGLKRVRSSWTASIPGGVLPVRGPCGTSRFQLRTGKTQSRQLFIPDLGRFRGQAARLGGERLPGIASSEPRVVQESGVHSDRDVADDRKVQGVARACVDFGVPTWAIEDDDSVEHRVRDPGDPDLVDPRPTRSCPVGGKLSATAPARPAQSLQPPERRPRR
jgi:hypothetical protein